MTHAMLAATMTQRELVEWRIHYASEPRGEERADWQAGWIAYVLASINARKGKKLRWADFIPFRKAPPDEGPREFTDDNIKAVFGALPSAKRSAPSPPKRG